MRDEDIIFIGKKSSHRGHGHPHRRRHARHDDLRETKHGKRRARTTQLCNQRVRGELHRYGGNVRRSCGRENARENGRIHRFVVEGERRETRGDYIDDESCREERNAIERANSRGGEQIDGETDGIKRGVFVGATSNGLRRRASTALAGSIRFAVRRRSLRKNERTRGRRFVRRTS